MAEYDLYQADAFTSDVFCGNPAAVVLLKEWLPDEMLLGIARENNLAETAYVIREAAGQYKLRWFTPGVEVDLCGHATLASAHILYTELKEDAPQLRFTTRSGTLVVSKEGDTYRMDLPAYQKHVVAPQFQQQIYEAVGAMPVDIVEDAFLLAIFENAETVRNMTPDMPLISNIMPANDHQGCLLVTAPGDQGYDFVSRLFAPGIGVPEDPVTGSAHCMLTPYWAGKTGKSAFRAWQASPRGGEVLCETREDRVVLRGKAVTYLKGKIRI